MSDVVIYTIGYTKKSAQEFFAQLRAKAVKHLLDVRLKNTSQLAGFTKKDDLKYFLKELLGIDYREIPELAPDEGILKEYIKTSDWPKYERSYVKLIKDRRSDAAVNPTWLREGAVLLCGEPKADHCHRRLAAEYVASVLAPSARIVHL